MERIKHAVLRTLYVPPDGVEIKVPYSFLGSSYDQEERDAIRRVLDSGWLTTGHETVAFETAFAEMHQVKYAYAVSNCTAALHLAAQLCRLREGDEVITTPITFISTNQAILARGATPVFTDVDPRTWNLDPNKIEASLTPRTRAIFLTHLTGQMCDMDAIMDIARRHDLLVVEDCAHAAGASYKGRFAGSFGDVGCFSFHAIKNMTTLGEGGMITTQRDDFALRIPWLRSMGSRYPDDPHEDGSPGPRPYEIDDVDGYVPSNVRMTEAQAAVGQVQLKKLPEMNARRQEIARRWSSALQDLPGITVPYEDPNCNHVYHIYALVIDPEVAGFTNHDLHHTLMYDYGIHTVPGLYRPSYLFELYRKRGFKPGICPIAERVAANSIQLPLFPRLTEEQVVYVIDSVRSAYEKLRKK